MVDEVLSKGGRPRKEWKLKVIGGVSVQVWFRGKYVGSYPLKKLYQLVAEKTVKRIAEVSV